MRSAGFRAVLSPSLQYWNWPDGAVDPWRSFRWFMVRNLIFFGRQVVSEIAHIASFNPDVIVSDTRLSSIIAGKMLGKPVLTILNQLYIIAPGFVHHRFVSNLAKAFCLGVVASLWGLSDTIIVPDFPPPYTIAAQNMLIPKIYREKVKFIGPILPVRYEELPEVGEIRKKFGLDDRPLIYAALSGPRSERRWFGEKLLKAFKKFPDRYQVVVSLGDLGNSHNANNSHYGENVKVYNWLPQRFEMLKASDIVVGRGGHTTTVQSLAYGKPLILIPTQEQTEQIGNAKTALMLGVAEVLDQRRISAEILLNASDRLLNSKDYSTKAREFRETALKTNAIEDLTSRIVAYAGSR
ncbi:MAG: glycosyltransferase [Candidatus Bathyarchaeia archaeon]